jgi:hypothetical protein
MKNTMLLMAVLCLSFSAMAQQVDSVKKTDPQKVVDKAQQVNDKTREISNASNQVTEQARQTADNIKNTVANVKAVIKIFEPVVNLHIFKKKENNATNPPSENVASTENTQNNQVQQNQNTAGLGNNPGFVDGSNNNPATVDPNGGIVYGTPENEQYNADGTMNCGHQNNGKYGNCINLLEAKVLGMGEAETDPAKIDLIFFSQYGGLGYSFESPHDAPTINEGVAVKSWRERNETEIAQTQLTIDQFEKISTNSEMINVVKNTQGYSANFYTSNKMDGRVFAIKIMQDDKQLYALLAVYTQFGTSGSKGYLKIKIKVQGVDTNGDGNPDSMAYQRQ